MKTHVNITLETELVKRARQLNINISAATEEYIKILIARKTQNTEAINLEIEKLKFKELSEKIAQLQSEANICNENIRKVEELGKKAEIEALEREKEQLKRESSCINCGSPFNPKTKTHKFKAGNVCNACFMSSDRDMVRKWNQAQDE